MKSISMRAAAQAIGLSVLLSFTSLAVAEDAATSADEAAPATEVAPAADAAGEADDKGVVSLQATGDHVVDVNTGNETVDAAANYASKCAERAAAMKACDSMGSFKAMACRKVAGIRYKEATNCPEF